RQYHGVFETTVHTLAVERHDRVSGVANQQGATVQMPAIQIERGQGPDRVVVVVLAEAREQGQQPRELVAEKCRRSIRVGQAGETWRRALGGWLACQKQRDRETALGIRQ